MKARGFLARKKLQPGEPLDATRNRMGKAEALKLARSVEKIFAAKGKSVVVFDLTKDAPTVAQLAAAIVGPTGNLRAPTVRRGSTLIVGFNSEMYEKVFAEAKVRPGKASRPVPSSTRS